MGKKNIVLAAAAMMAAAGGLAPTAVETASAIADNGTQITQQTPRRNVNQGQRNGVEAQQNAKAYQRSVYDNGVVPYPFVDGGMPPHIYGRYLLMTGKNKYNDRKNKRFAK